MYRNSSRLTLCHPINTQDPAWLAGIYWQGRKPGFVILEQGCLKHLVALLKGAATEAGRGAAAGAICNLVATAGRHARTQAIQEGAIPPLLHLCVFGRGCHLSTFHLNLSRFCHCPLLSST